MQVYDLHLLIYMLNTANIQTIFEKSKKKQLFYVVNEDICGFICICVHLYVILFHCITKNTQI